MKNKKMKLARLERDMSQAQLAEAVGVTRQTIGLVESGAYNPTLKLCTEICRVLDKTLDQLFWEVEDEIGDEARRKELPEEWGKKHEEISADDTVLH